MIYSNVNVSAVERQLDFGTIHQITLGELGRGRKLLALTCPKGTEVKAGMNTGITIGLTRSGKPRIDAREDEELYMLLSAEGGYTRRGCGVIRVLKAEAESFEILARGNGADGDAGRIGFWDCMLLRAPKNGIVSVQPSGKGYGIMPEIYVIKDCHVYKCDVSQLDECCEALGLEEPYVLEKDEYDDYKWSDWQTL